MPVKMLHGAITGKSAPSKAVAKEFVSKTPAKKRSMFAKALKSSKNKKGY